MRKEWFEKWFDSPYYHILYQNHNEKEAHNFIDNLLTHLTLLTPQYEEKSKQHILDLACGKGRHSRYMASKGYEITGVDLSYSSIKYAIQFETDNLTFYQNDMRKPFRINYFDYIFNFFTSFGYFKNDNENLMVLKNIEKGLKPYGVFVMDYFNSYWIRENIKTDYYQEAGGINFFIKKYINNGYVLKKIKFHTEGLRPEDSGVDYKFEEKVRLFTLEDFEILFDKANLKIIDIFGDYQLNPFDKKSSKRLIIKALRK